MHTLKRFLFALMIGLLLFNSCKKEVMDHSLDLNPTSLEIDNPPFVSGEGGIHNETNIIETILGPARNNPYTVEVMKNAWNNLYPEHQLNNLAPTHLYVKFSPGSEEDYKLLAKTNEMFYDYPLENEMITLGDFYPQTDRQFPELWAVVPPDFQSPIAGYSILAQLFIPRYNTELTREAFELTGNAYNTGGDPMYVKTDDNILSLVAPTNPEDGGGGSGNSDPNLTKNDCQCVVYADYRKPGGCVKVMDVEHQQFEGVRHVKIITKDSWFTEDETETDDNGCWKINDQYHGDMWMWVKFTGPVCQIRGVKDGLNYLLGWSHPVKDYLGKIRTGPPYNNIAVNYNIWVNRGSSAHMNWAAATINNAVHEFHQYATSEGIATPPFLDIFEVGNMAPQGITLMANYLPTIPAGFITSLIPSWLYRQLPDIGMGVDSKHSDQIKEIVYHESAHASHFVKAGPQFWMEVQKEEADGILNHGGNPYYQVGGIVDLAEAWAYHVGWFFADKNYPNPNRSVRWSFKLESTRNRELQHMPVGVFYDLIDKFPNGNEYDTSDLNPYTCCFTVNDKVQGFNCGQMFNLLGGNTKSTNNFYQQFKSHFGNNNLVLLQSLDDLFNSY